MAEDSASDFSVILVSVDGVEAPAEKIAERFKLPGPVARRLVESTPIIVKRSVRERSATRYVAALLELGARALAVPVGEVDEELAALRKQLYGSGLHRLARTLDSTGGEPTDAELGVDDFAGFLGDGPSAEVSRSASGAVRPVSGSFNSEAADSDAAVPETLDRPGGIKPPEMPPLDARDSVDVPAVGATTGAAGEFLFGPPLEEAPVAPAEGGTPGDDPSPQRLAQIAPIKMSAREIQAARKVPEPVIESLADAANDPLSTGDLNDFGTLELPDANSASGLQLDTTKPHLTGPLKPIGEVLDFIPQAPVEEAEEATAPADAAPLPSPPALPPVAGELISPEWSGSISVHRLQRPTPRRRALSVVLMLFFLLGLGLAGLGGFLYFQHWSSQGTIRAWQSADVYLEFEIKLGNERGMQGCALVDEEAGEYLCRFSPGWFALVAPSLPESALESLSQTCLGRLREGDAVSSLRLDCVVPAGAGEEERRTRVFVNEENRCEQALTSLGSGDSMSCENWRSAGLLPADAPVPAPSRQFSEIWQFRQEQHLDTRVGRLPVRLFFVTAEDGSAERRYYSPTLKIMIRVAGLAAETTRQISFMEQPGERGGEQRWTR